MTARSRRNRASNATLSLAALALAAAAFARAPGAAAQPERLGQPAGNGFATLDDKEDWYAGRVPRSQQAPWRATATTHEGVFVDVVDVSQLELRYDEPEVSALGGARLDPAALGTPVTGGFTLGLGGRALRWLRLPELLLSLGGATLDGTWQRPSGQAAGLEVRPTSLFLLRVELSAGVLIPTRHVRPYALARIAGSYYSVSTDVRHPELGALGSESVGSWSFDVGTEVGLAFPLGDAFELDVGWRACWYGVPSQGMTLTFVAGRSLR
jgi:hypothetical protein